MGIQLISTTDILQLRTGGSQSVDMYADYFDDDAGVFASGVAHGNVATSSTVTLCGSPGSSTARNVKYISITNTDPSNSVQITVYYSPNNGTTQRQLGPSFALGPGQSWQYNDLEGWILNDAAGGRVQTPLAGRWLKSTLLTSTSSATFTTGPSTNSLRVRMVGGGGQGGGNAATTGTTGAGGGSGAYLEATIPVTPNIGYTYQCGAGGSTGGTAANGQNGSSTTLTVGATTYTAPGGGGGTEGTSISVPVLGGAGGTLPTTGNIMNSAGEPGEPAITTGTAANNRSGMGGSSQLGGGAASVLEATNTTGSSAAALGYGGGGSGSATSAATARAGGAGAPGCIVIDEYS